MPVTSGAKSPIKKGRRIQIYHQLVMDLLIGGDLRYHMGFRRKFKETEAKFFIACILIALEYLHLNKIIHRDIKP